MRLILVPLLLFVLPACKKKADAAGNGGPGAGGGAPAMPVEAAVAKQDTVVDAISATGQVEPVQQIELRPEVEGRLVEILVREGSEVAQGQPLFRIDDQELKAEVARAEADRDLANQSLARAKQLTEQNASSAADLERAEAMARMNQAQLDLLKVRLARTTVRAPFGGTSGQRFVSVGDYVTTSDTLATLQTVNPQRIAFAVPERYASRLGRGQRVVFRVASLSGQEFQGTVDFVDPVVRLPARTILVKALVPNGRRQLQAGMFVEVRLATEVRPRAVVVPEDAIVPLQRAYYVWVVTDGKASRHQVEIGVRSPGFVEIKSGVQAGEQVVVGGQERLAEGAPVMATVVERGPVIPGDSGGPATKVDSSGKD
jgi:membrane fusion protein (multidrug efflux system)